MSRSPPGFATGIAFVAGKPADTHPPDLLRLHVLKGATEALDEFHSQLDWIREIGSIVSGVEQEVSYLDLYFGDPLTPYRFDQAGLCALQRDAEKIGNALVTMPLERLHHKRISDIETWGSNDEEGVEKVRRAALKGPKGGALRGLGVDNAHLMAGGILALCDGASVKETNAMLRDAFSESFRKVSYYA